MRVWIEPLDREVYDRRPGESAAQHFDRLKAMERAGMEWISFVTQQKLIGLAIIHFGGAAAILAGTVYLYFHL